MASDCEKMAGESFLVKWNHGSSLEKSDLVLELVQSVVESPLVGWRILYKLENQFKVGDLDAACCTKIANCILPTVEFFSEQNSNVENETIILKGIHFFIGEFMSSVCLNEGPDVSFECLTYLYKQCKRSAPYVEMISALQNVIVDYYVAQPESKPPAQCEKMINFWFDAIVYALETSRFNTSSEQVVTLCRSIGDMFFGGAKLNSALKKLSDFSGKVDQTRSDFPYLFDIELAKLVKRFAHEQGALIGYSFLWAFLKGFVLRMKNENDYLSVLMLLVHLLQAVGAPIKCMATPSLLEYPQADLGENERLFHLVKLLEIYIESELYHPSVLLSGMKRFKGNLIFNDILVYVLRHEAKGSTNWFKALLSLANISASIIAPKLRMILQVAWFDCSPADCEAQDEFVTFVIDIYDRMHRAADFYTRLLGAVNDYLVKAAAGNPTLSQSVRQRMRTSFARLAHDDTVRIWTEYVKYLLQVLEKWRQSDAQLSSVPHTFVLSVFGEFVQHCPLVAPVQLSSEQNQRMDRAVQDTLTLTAKLEQTIDTLPPKTSKQLLANYVQLMQKFVKVRFVRGYYFSDAFRDAFTEAAERQQQLVEQVDNKFRKTLKKQHMLRLDVLCNAVKLSDNPKRAANRCLSEICENFHSIDWQLLIHHHPQVLSAASRRNVDVFVALLFRYVQQHNDNDDNDDNNNNDNNNDNNVNKDNKDNNNNNGWPCLYVKTQTFRDSSKQVLSFVKLIAADLRSALANFNRDFERVFDVENLDHWVEWATLKRALDSVERPHAQLNEAILNARKMLDFVPVYYLAPAIRLKVLAMIVTCALVQNDPTEEFFAACFHFLEDLSSALKLKCDDSDETQLLLFFGRLATLCLKRVLSIDPTLTMQRATVKKCFEFIRYVLFVMAKKAKSVAAFETLMAELPLKNDANFCTMLLLVETLTRVHSKSISSDDASNVRSKCQRLMNNALGKRCPKVKNVVFVSNKYIEVFGAQDAVAIQSIAAAVKTAAASIVQLKWDVAAFQLCVRASEVQDVVEPSALVYFMILLGETYLSELVQLLTPRLTKKLVPIVETMFDDLGHLSAFVESLPADVGGSFKSKPFSFYSSVDCPLTTDTVFDRCLELTCSLVKHMDEEAITPIVSRVYQLISVRSFLPNLRLDLCCSILDAATRKQTCPELFFPIYSALGSIPLKSLTKTPVDQWCTIMSITTDMYSRAFLFKPNFTNGIAQILLGATGRLIEAIVARCDRQSVNDDDNNNNISHVAKIIHVIDDINRVLFMLNRMKSKDRTKTLESCGSLLIASYLRSIVEASIDEKFRMDLKSMAFLILGLCTSKGLFALKLESSLAVQEALRRLIEEYKVKCNVRRF